VCALIEKLIRKKVLYPERVLDKYFVIAMDGSGTLTFADRHCSQCLTATHNGKTLYFHKVLEAKLVTPSGFAFSIMTEFIENPGEKPTKQDCELKAFYRLAARLKKRFPRLPILLSLDGLFAGGPTFEICRKYGWQHMIVLKDHDLPSVNEEFETLSRLLPQNLFSCRPVGEAEICQCYRWVENISYVDTDRRQHILSVIECLETKPDEKGVTKTTKFKWVTCLPISAKTVAHLANNGGRIRWKVENEGFNVQKNGGYGLEHAYTSNSTSAKIFYFLLQIAHMVAQLLDRGNLLRNLIPAGFGSAKNLAFRLLEAWRNARVSAADMQALLARHLQIRLDDSS
jgi:hypothetical protein